MVTSDAIYKNLNNKLFYIPKSNMTDCDDAESGIMCGYNVAHAPSNFTGYVFLFTFSYNGDANYRVQFCVKISSTDVYLRRKTGGVWDSWQLLAKL